MATLNYTQPNKDKAAVLSIGDVSLEVTGANFQESKDTSLSVGSDPKVLNGNTSVSFTVTLEDETKSLEVFMNVSNFLGAISKSASVMSPNVSSYGNMVNASFMAADLEIARI